MPRSGFRLIPILSAISSRNYAIWHALIDATESWHREGKVIKLAMGSNTSELVSIQQIRFF